MFIDAEELVVYIARTSLSLPAQQVSVEMPAKPPLPFVLVTRVAAVDDKITETATVSVQVFANSRVTASDVARQLHSHMLSVSAKTAYPLSTGAVSVDLVETFQGPAWVGYADEDLERYVARYGIASRITSQPLT